MLTAYLGSFRSLTSGDVSTLYDQSGNSRNFLDNGSGATRASLDTGLGFEVLSFDGSADWLATGIALSNFITASDGYTICSFKPTGFSTDSGTGYLNATLFQDSGGNFGSTTKANSGSPLLISTNWGGGNAVQHSIVANTWYVVETWHTGGNFIQRLNGNTAGQQQIASGNTSLGGTLNLGGRFVTAGFQGLIGEAVIFSSVPTLTDRDAFVQAMGLYVGASV